MSVNQPITDLQKAEIPSVEEPAEEPVEEQVEAPVKKRKKKRPRAKNPKDVLSKYRELYAVPEDMPKPDYWVLPNRTHFLNWVNNTFDTKKNIEAECSCSPDYCELNKSKLFTQQKLVRDFFQLRSPYRGILLYHGLGVGKTCASIAIAEGMKDKRDVIFLSKAKLEKNFRNELKKCGNEYYKSNNHWAFFKCKTTSKLGKECIIMGIPEKIILDNKGVWLIEESLEPNFEDLSDFQKEQILYQIDTFINNKYSFLHLDAPNLVQKLEHIKNKTNANPFNNKLLIIDEVHNLTNSMAKDKPGLKANYLEKLIMEAKNLRLVFLSGTPLVNDIYEIAKVFNLLRGYIKTYIYHIKDKINYRDVVRKLKALPFVDHIISNPSKKYIVITRNPNYYFNNENKTGVIYEDNTLEENDFIKNVSNVFGNITPSIKYTTALPHDSEIFFKYFYDENSNSIINSELFGARINGLVSFYRTVGEELMPSVSNGLHGELVKVPMSDHQFNVYLDLRFDELKKEEKRNWPKKTKKTKKTKKDQKKNIFKETDTYKAFSRMACSFVFPQGMKRPKMRNMKYNEDTHTVEYDSAGEYDDDDIDGEIHTKEQINKLKISAYETAKRSILEKIVQNSKKYLNKDTGELRSLSPKYYKLLENISTSPGLIFVYSEYRNLEGLAILSKVLNANGYAQFRIKKNAQKQWDIDINPADMDKTKYIVWGKQDDMDDVLLKIFNNKYTDIVNLSSNLKDYLFSNNNLRGDIAKIFMTTQTGAEGITLQNVRQVHILEPYWNYGRLEQVMGRAIRACSHERLEEDERNVAIYTYLATFTENQKKVSIPRRDNQITTDEYLYNKSQKKRKVINELFQVMKNVAFDCNIHKDQNTTPLHPIDCQNTNIDYYKDGYVYLPDISSDFKDNDRKRRVKQVQSKVVLKSFPKLKVPNTNDEFLLNQKTYELFLKIKSGNQITRGKKVGKLIKDKTGKIKPKFELWYITEVKQGKRK